MNANPLGDIHSFLIMHSFIRQIFSEIPNARASCLGPELLGRGLEATSEK